jgi:hypothetical protein
MTELVLKEKENFKKLIKHQKTNHNWIEIESDETEVEGRPNPVRTAVNQLIRDDPILAQNPSLIMRKVAHYNCDKVELASTIRSWIYHFNKENKPQNGESKIKGNYSNWWHHFVIVIKIQNKKSIRSAKDISRNKSNSFIERWITPPTQPEPDYYKELNIKYEKPEGSDEDKDYFLKFLDSNNSSDKTLETPSNREFIFT